LEYLQVYHAIITPKPGLSVGFLVITNFCMQSQEFFLENDTLFRSGLL